MRRSIFALGLVALAVLAAVPGALRAQQASPSPTPIPPLIERIGLVVPELDALQRIQFRPFLPGHPTQTALLAPFHTVGQSDNPANYGIAFAYVEKGHTFVLRQWPRASGSLATFTQLPGEPACKDAYLTLGAKFWVQAVGWQTARYIFILQPDDDKLAADRKDRGRALKAEWHRLALRGACR